jgi:hypothetical protein
MALEEDLEGRVVSAPDLFDKSPVASQREEPA